MLDSLNRSPFSHIQLGISSTIFLCVIQRIDTDRHTIKIAQSNGLAAFFISSWIKLGARKFFLCKLTMLNLIQEER